MINLNILVLEHSSAHLLGHCLTANGCIICDEKHLLANAFKPLDVFEGLTDLDILSMPEDAIAIEEKVVVLCG